jgi:hypothetical protein
MEAIFSSETLIHIQTTRRCIPVDGRIYSLMLFTHAAHKLKRKKKLSLASNLLLWRCLQAATLV